MNPAILLLLRSHAASRGRRLRHSFSSTRRTILTLAAFALGTIWLGQTIASVMFRDPYNPATFHRWTALILATYFGWHFVRVAYKRPDHAIEWSAAEQAQIVGGPFRRVDLLAYRFLVILTSTLPKGLLAAFVLLPDLWWSGLPGILLALVFLELFRMAIDIAVCCLNNRQYNVARSLVFGGLLLAAALVVVRAGQLPTTTDPTAIGWLHRCGTAAETLRDSVAGQVLERPFVVFADVITAQGLSAGLVVNSLLVVLMVGGLMRVVCWLDHRHESLVVQRQRELLSRDVKKDDETVDAGIVVPLPAIPRLASIGPIVWRQCRSALRYRGSLLVAVAIPGVLSCLPLLSVQDTTYAFLALVATVVFYSFVLLPEAIKFDFRLDSDYLTQLKLLPIPPLRLVAGQLAVPILVATLFQSSLYLLAGIVRPVPPLLIVAAILLSVPVNILFVAIDNLIFLLYPHRPTQEGFEAFVRTILKFSFKSLMLGVAGGFVLFWALSSRILVDALGAPDQVRFLFLSGLCLATWASAALSLAAVTFAFDRFDVSEGIPA